MLLKFASSAYFIGVFKHQAFLKCGKLYSKHQQEDCNKKLFETEREK